MQGTHAKQSVNGGSLVCMDPSTSPGVVQKGSVKWEHLSPSLFSTQRASCPHNQEGIGGHMDREGGSLCSW